MNMIKTFCSIRSVLPILALVSQSLMANPIEVGVPVEFQPGIKGAVELTFQSQVGVYYQLEVSVDLGEWDNEGHAVKGTGGEMTLLASTRNLPTLFYRLRDDGDPANLAPALPTGTVVIFAGINPPPGWVLCDGAVFSQNDAPSLYAAISTTYNIGGEGSGNFRVPDLRGRVAVGGGQGTNLSNRLMGTRFGAETNTLEASNLPSHSHSIPAGNTAGSGQAFVRAASNNNGTVFSSASGSSMPHNITQPSLVLNYIIKL